jgi:hypothetical protein
MTTVQLKKMHYTYLADNQYVSLIPHGRQVPEAGLFAPWSSPIRQNLNETAREESVVRISRCQNCKKEEKRTVFSSGKGFAEGVNIGEHIKQNILAFTLYLKNSSHGFS